MIKKVLHFVELDQRPQSDKFPRKKPKRLNMYDCNHVDLGIINFLCKIKLAEI
jgi:hypothetical protein